jgi:enoyl-CoA hydratase/carnithine racemase
MSPPDVLVFEHRDDVAWLTMSRPTAANALDAAMNEALVEALRRCADDPAVRAVVLTGHGGRVFSAGADLKEFAELADAEARPRRRELLRATLLALADFDKPLIACVNGKAVGAGCMLALLADEVHVGPSAQFSLPEIRLGTATPVGASIVAARCGRRGAHRLAQAGEPIDADAAVATGLADAAWSADELGAICQDRARALGTLNGAAYAQNKRWLNAGLRAEISRALDESARLQAEAKSEEQERAA